MLYSKMSLLVRIALVLFVIASVQLYRGDAEAQTGSELYLLSGFPVGNSDVQVPTRLYRVSDGTRELKKVTELFPQTENTEFIRAFHDKRLLVAAAPHFRPQRIVVIRMDSPCRPVSVNMKGSDFLSTSSYVLDIPQRGMYLAQVGYSVEETVHQLAVFNLMTGQEEKMDPSVLKYALQPGLSGVGHEDNYLMDVFVDPRGFVRKSWMDAAGKHLIDFDWPALPYAAQPEKKTGRWPINGIEQTMGTATWTAGSDYFELLAIRGVENRSGGTAYELLDRSKETWRELPIPGIESLRLKPFGPWLAGVPLGEKRQRLPQETVDRIKAEKREKDIAFSNLLAANPKPELFLYNSQTDRQYTIETGDIESEVVLIENETVYYRVKDRLYRASVRDGRVGPPELVAQDPALADVYWAFSGPPCTQESK